MDNPISEIIGGFKNFTWENNLFERRPDPKYRVYNSTIKVPYDSNTQDFERELNIRATEVLPSKSVRYWDIQERPQTIPSGIISYTPEYVTYSLTFYPYNNPL